MGAFYAAAVRVNTEYNSFMIQYNKSNTILIRKSKILWITVLNLVLQSLIPEDYCFTEHTSEIIETQIVYNKLITGMRL